MPKEYANFPQPIEFSHVSVDTETGATDAGVDVFPPGPQIGIHWDGSHGIVQLSLSIDWDTLQRIVKHRLETNEMPEEDPTREVIYTEALDRGDLQRLIRHTRRARDAVFGADE